MVKKCLIAIAVVALLATTVQAGSTIKFDPQTDPTGWPWTKTIEYDPFDICTFNVVLEVGHFVQLKDCGDLEMKLEQVTCEESKNFPCYEGCVDIKARANFPAVFGADFTGSDVDIIDDFDLDWEGDDDQILGDGSWESLKLCMTAKKVALWASGTTSGTVKVGSITINVKPPTEVTSGP